MREARLTGDGVIRKTKRVFAFEVRFLDEDDVDAALALHRQVIRRMPEQHLLYERDRDFFRHCVGTRGCVAGAWADGQLVGYAAAAFPVPGDDDYSTDLGFPPSEGRHITHLVGSAVRPEYRGNKLQTRLTTLRAAYAAAKDRWHLCGEVVPGNAVSLENHLNVGFFLKAYRIDRLGLPCFLVHRDMRSTPRRVDPSDAEEASFRNVSRLREHVVAGLWGFGMEWRDGEPLVQFGRFVLRDVP